ncbi:MAG: hypothetical protein Q7S81_00065 [bacterium]|nr:hypothetical protein [bacterium]
MSINLYKKIIIGSVLMGLILNPAFLLPFEIKKANAVLGVADTAFVSDVILDTAIPAAIAKQTVSETVMTLKKFVGMMLKKVILDKMVNQAAQWIQKGGFEGKGGDMPFVEDIGSFLQQAGDEAVGLAAAQVVPQLCSPFQLNVAVNLFAPVKEISGQAACTLSGITENLDNFFKDFRKESKGRWLSYNAAWEPQNNYFGSTLIAKDVYDKVKNEKQMVEEIKLNLGSGFFPQQRCSSHKEKQADGTFIEVSDGCKTVTPGKYISDSILKTSYTKSDAILSADDISTYIGTLLDAVLYRYSTLAMGGLKAYLAKGGADREEANARESCKKTNSCWEDAVTAQFNQIDRITFQNNKALYLNEIRSVLTTKRSTRDNLNSAINTETALISSLENIQLCSAPVGTFTNDQDTLKTNIGIVISNETDVLSSITARRDDMQNQITDLEKAQNEFALFSDTDEPTMNIDYLSLVSSGTLDATMASTALTDSQTDLTAIQQNSDALLKNPATSGGYSDIITICSAIPTVPVTP